MHWTLVLLIGFFLYCLINLFEALFDIIAPNPKYERRINKKAFVHEVAAWGLSNMVYEGVQVKRRGVEIRICYYKNKKIFGDYYAHSNLIRIFVNNSDNLEELIDTVLHEVVHHFQYLSDKRNFSQKYAKLLEEKTYQHHPMEIEARKYAAHYMKHCRDYMLSQGYMVRI